MKRLTAEIYHIAVPLFLLSSQTIPVKAIVSQFKMIYKPFLTLWAQLFEGRLALNPGLNLTRVSFSFVQKHFLGQFSLIFIEHRIINLLTKIIKLNLFFQLSYLNSSFALTLGYLKPALNNPALDGKIFQYYNL